MPVHGSGTPTPNIGAPIVVGGVGHDAPDGPTQLNDIAYLLDQLASAQDGLQDGVVSSGDAAVSSLAVAGSGAVTGTLAAVKAWITNAAGLRVRGANSGGAFNLGVPASLPATTKFAVVGIDLVAPAAGAGVTIAVSAKGTDQTTSALALANPPATASGRIRILDVVILNTAGTYSLSASRDRRPWARGALSQASITNSATSGSAQMPQRVECSGVPVLITGWILTTSTPTVAAANLNFFPAIDGSGGAFGQVEAPITNDPTIRYGYSFSQIVPVAAGSHLLQSFASLSSGSVNVTAYMTARELLCQPPTNNGTS